MAGPDVHEALPNEIITPKKWNDLLQDLAFPADILVWNNTQTINISTNVPSLDIDSESTTASIIDISGDKITTGSALSATDLDALTTGSGINIVSNSTNTGTFNLIRAHVDNSAATGATAIRAINDSTGDALKVEGDVTIEGDVSIAPTAINIYRGPFERNENLVIERPSTTTVDIDASQITVFDSLDTGIVLGSAGVPSSINLTLNQDNDTAGGGSNGVLGLDVGSFTNSKWYYLYVIYNGSTISCVASLAQNWISTTNDGSAGTTKGVDKTNISGYSFGRRVGAVYQNSSGTFNVLDQQDNHIDLEPSVAYSGSSGGSYASLDVSPFIPATAKFLIFRGQCSSVGDWIKVFYAPTDTSTGLGEIIEEIEPDGCGSSTIYTNRTKTMRIKEPQTIYHKKTNVTLMNIEIIGYKY